MGCIYRLGHRPWALSSGPHRAAPVSRASPGEGSVTDPLCAPVSQCTHPSHSHSSPQASISGGAHIHTHTHTHKQSSFCKQLLVKLKLNSAQILTFGGDTNSANIFTSFINGPDHSALYTEVEEVRAAEVPKQGASPPSLNGALPKQCHCAPSCPPLSPVPTPAFRRMDGGHEDPLFPSNLWLLGGAASSSQRTQGEFCHLWPCEIGQQNSPDAVPYLPTLLDFCTDQSFTV